MLYPLTGAPRRHDRDRRRLRRPRPARRRADAGRLPPDRRADRRAVVLERSCPRTSSTTSPAAVAMEIPTNTGLKLYGRPGESADDFAGPLPPGGQRQGRRRRRPSCATKYEAKVGKLQAPDRRRRERRRRRRGAAEGPPARRPAVVGRLDPRRPARRAQVDAAGCSASSAGPPGAPGKTSAAGARVDAAQGKVERLEAAAAGRRGRAGRGAHRDRRPWDGTAAGITTMSIPLEKSDVKVTQLVLAWIPVP